MKKIELTQNQFAIVDDGDYEWLSQFKWCASWSKGTKSYYAVRKIPLQDGRRTIEQMHRRIMGLRYGDKNHVDHINGDTLDNRKENLRICTHKENSRNRKGLYSNNTSGVSGVYWNKRDQKWYAQAYNNDGKRKHLGYFNNKLDAEMVVLEYKFKNYGEYMSEFEQDRYCELCVAV